MVIFISTKKGMFVVPFSKVNIISQVENQITINVSTMTLENVGTENVELLPVTKNYVIEYSTEESAKQVLKDFYRATFKKDNAFVFKSDNKEV